MEKIKLQCQHILEIDITIKMLPTTQYRNPVPFERQLCRH